MGYWVFSWNYISDWNFKIWPPVGTTGIGYKYDHNVAPLAFFKICGVWLKHHGFGSKSECDICIDFDINECLNMCVSWKQYEQKMLENRPKDAQGSLVKTVETEGRILKYLTP